MTTHPNSVLAFGLSGVADYTTNRPFLNLLKHGRVWQAERNDANGNRIAGYDSRALIALGHITPDGAVSGLPADVRDNRVVSPQIWRASGLPLEAYAGDYRMRWKGTGTVGVGIGASVVAGSRQDVGGYHQATVRVHGGEWQLDVRPPFAAGDPLREMSLVHMDNVAAYDAGAIFDPAYLRVLRNARLIRFMDMGNTNNSRVAAWSDRKPLGCLGREGLALEDMVALCNATGCDGWFNIPHLADADYVTRFATLLRDTLAPGLKAYVEYSNETWNFSFGQTQWAIERSAAVWNSSGGPGYLNWLAKKAAEAMRIVTNVFGPGEKSRLVRVCGTQSVSPGNTQTLMEAPLWKQFEPTVWFDPKPYYDVVAGTTYFGGSHVGNQTLRTKLLEAIDRGASDPTFDVQEWFFNEHMDPTLGDGMPKVKASWHGHKAYCRTIGKPFIAYEGGQHIHHSFAVSGLDGSGALEKLTTFMTAFMRSQWMADLYLRSAMDWAEVGDGPYMQFCAVGASSQYGSWFIWEGNDDAYLTKRGRALLDWGANTTPWW